MIVIEKAVLHILDLVSGVTVYSDEELTLDEGIGEFLLRHIDKSLASQDAKFGEFYEDSACKQQIMAYFSGEKDLVTLSKELAHTLEEALIHTEDKKSTDLIVADIRVDEERKLVVFQCSSHMGFVHQVNHTEQGIRNDIIHHHAIMPNPAQRMEEFAFIDARSLAISFAGKKYVLDGCPVYILPEVLLECSQTASPKEAIKSIRKTAERVAKDFEQNEVATAAAVKNYIAENAQNSEMLDPVAAGREIFKDQPSMQAEYEERIKEAGMAEPVRVDQEVTAKKMSKHRLRTDTGIELSIPTDYFDNTEFLEFYNHEDGTLSIMLKQISNITNRG